MPDFDGLIRSMADSLPGLGGAFILGMQVAAALIVLIGVVYFLRRTV